MNFKFPPTCCNLIDFCWKFFFLFFTAAMASSDRSPRFFFSKTFFFLKFWIEEKLLLRNAVLIMNRRIKKIYSILLGIKSENSLNKSSCQTHFFEMSFNSFDRNSSSFNTFDDLKWNTSKNFEIEKVWLSRINSFWGGIDTIKCLLKEEKIFSN